MHTAGGAYSNSVCAFKYTLDMCSCMEYVHSHNAPDGKNILFGIFHQIIYGLRAYYGPDSRVYFF